MNASLAVEPMNGRVRVTAFRGHLTVVRMWSEASGSGRSEDEIVRTPSIILFRTSVKCSRPRLEF